MQKAMLLCVGGMVLFFGAASPALAQVTMLNGDNTLNPPNPPVGASTAPSPNGPTASLRENAPNSLIVTGPINNGETVPNINLDKSLSEQSGAPPVNDETAEKH